MRNALLLALLFQVTVSNPSGPGVNPTGRFFVSGTAPTPSATGIGATGSASLAGGSTDYSGILNLSVSGAGPAASGTGVITFTTGAGAYNAQPTCVSTLRNSTGTWDARATIRISPITATAVTFNWDNNAVALTAAQIYSLTYICVGM